MAEVNGICAETKCNIPVIAKENIAVIETEVTTSVSSGYTWFSKNLAYPEGFTKDNCIPISVLYNGQSRFHVSRVSTMSEINVNLSDSNIIVTADTIQTSTSETKTLKVALYKYA